MFEGKDVKILLANAGSGKGNWVDCIVPTPQGRRRFGDLVQGDYLFDRTGKPTKIVDVYKRGVIPCYKVTLSDKRCTYVSLDHLWEVKKAYTKTPLFLATTEDLLNSGKGLLRKDGTCRYKIRANGINEYEAKQVPIDPYVFGVFTGNGCLTLPYLTLSSNDLETVEKVSNILEFSYHKQSKYNYSWTFKNNGEKVKNFFESLSATEKYIPDVYKYNSVDVRMKVLQGLFDTNGSVSFDGVRLNVTYSSISKRLIEDVKEMLQDFGVVSCVREDNRDKNKHICYRLYINGSVSFLQKVFSLKRKKDITLKCNREKYRDYNFIGIKKIEYIGEREINCVWVDNEEHLYQCDDGIVTHNTYNLIKQISKELETKRPEEIAFVTFTRKGAEEGLKRVCSKLMLEPDELPYFRTLHSLTFHALNLNAKQMFGRLDQRKFNKEFGYDVNRCEVDTHKVAPTKDTQYLEYYDLERSNALTSKQIAETDIEQGYYKQLTSDYEEYKRREQKVDFFDCLIKYVEQGETLPVKTVYCDECFSPETHVRMADMSVKEIKDIKVGDYVMGTENKAVRVTAIKQGKDRLFDVICGKKQKLFTCNSMHLIEQHYGVNNSKARWVHSSEIKKNGFVRFSSVDNKVKNLKIDPYFFGLWLGNGFSREAVVVCNENDYQTINWLKDYGEQNKDKVTLRKRQGIIQVEYAVTEKHRALKCNIRKQLEAYGFMLSKTKDNEERKYKEKRIPLDFLQGSLEQRLKLLAGIIDSDGMYVKCGNTFKYRIEMARKELMLDIYNLLGSLGFNPFWYVTHHTTNGVIREYYRIDFFGSSVIPCKLPRKQFKGYSKEEYSCRIVENGYGDYVGITVDAQDNLFILENGAVVHNCQDISALQWKVIEKAFAKAEKFVLAGDDKQSIFTYSGARPDFLIDLAKKFPVEHLSMSYRIPYSVYELANGITNFIDEKTEQESKPRLENGEGKIMQLNTLDRLVNFIDEDCIKNDKAKTSWYILSRNNCFLTRPMKLLEDALIPYWTADGFFMGGDIMRRLKDYNKFALNGYKDANKKEEFQRKFGIEDFSRPFTETNLFTEDRKWVYEAYIEKYGLEKLEEMCKWNPPILVSTIHHVKGGEADNVAIMLDTTTKTKGNIYYSLDEELRILYVGVTRTKKNLFLIDSKNGEGYDNIVQTIKQENHLEW